MIEKLKNIFKVQELRKRILFTLAMMFVARIGVHISLPGVDISKMDLEAGGMLGNLLNYVDMFAGGGLKNFSIFSLGIIPYITASIVIQLLTIAFPHFANLQKEGEHGRRKMQKYTKYLTVAICMVQSIGLTQLMVSQNMLYASAQINIIWFRITSVIIIVSGTAFLMWLGDLITEKGIGNGISILIMQGIIVDYPYAVYKLWKYRDINNLNIVQMSTIAAGLFILIMLIVLVLRGERRVPLQTGKRAVGGQGPATKTSYMPFRVNQAGVIPVIFASSLMMAPMQLANFFSGRNEIISWISTQLSPQGNLYIILFAALIIFFTFFYVAIQFNSTDIADNMKKSGMFIPGIRPGEHTATYLEKVLNRISLPGSIFLAFIAVLPIFISRFYSAIPSRFFGGTGLLIVVGVDLEVLKQIESYLLTHHYDGFLNKGKIRSRR